MTDIYRCHSNDYIRNFSADLFFYFLEIMASSNKKSSTKVSDELSTDSDERESSKEHSDANDSQIPTSNKHRT